MNLKSDLPLPELSAARSSDFSSDAPLRVRLRRRRFQPARTSEWFVASNLPDGRLWRRNAKAQGGYLVSFPGLADFFVNNRGDEVACTRKPHGVSLATLRHLLLDQLFPMVLNLRGREALHATAIDTPSGVCAFIGPAGTGKSTLAASFWRAGYRSLGDDCLALQESRGDDDAGRDGILAIPAYPGLRLWIDSTEALAMDSSMMDPVTHYSSKRRIATVADSHGFPQQPRPLVRIYRLIRAESEAEGVDAPVIDPMPAREAFLELVSASFPLDTTDQVMLQRHFRFMERVMALVPLRRLRVPNDLNSLAAVREAVLSDLAAV